VVVVKNQPGHFASLPEIGLSVHVVMHLRCPLRQDLKLLKTNVVVGEVGAAGGTHDKEVAACRRLSVVPEHRITRRPGLSGSSG